jgi:hypothetical protein
MQFMLLSYASDQDFQAADPAQVQQTLAAFQAYIEALHKEGVYVTSSRLQPGATANTVRIANGKTEVLNGPYAETREQLGGYFVIEVADEAAALDWAKRCPAAAIGSLELRPVWAM